MQIPCLRQNIESDSRVYSIQPLKSSKFSRIIRMKWNMNEMQLEYRNWIRNIKNKLSADIRYSISRVEKPFAQEGSCDGGRSDERTAKVEVSNHSLHLLAKVGCAVHRYRQVRIPANRFPWISNIVRETRFSSTLPITVAIKTRCAWAWAFHKHDLAPTAVDGSSKKATPERIAKKRGNAGNFRDSVAK